MSTDQLSTALRDLVADADRGAVAPNGDDLWSAGRRRRLTSRAVPVGVVACLIALVAMVLWPAGPPRAAVPAERLDDQVSQQLTSYPENIAKPPFLDVADTPGVTAAIVPAASGAAAPYAVSPRGQVTRLHLASMGEGFAPDAWSLSPDGRWLAFGTIVTDLVDGRPLLAPAEQSWVERQWPMPPEPGWWSPDSRRVFVGGFNQGTPTSAGVLIGTDGTVGAVPLVEDGVSPIFAGWLDDDTLLALLDLGPGTSRLEVRTWTIGDPSWQANGAIVSWLDTDDASTVRALMSPDGQRLLLTASATDLETQELNQTVAMMFDPRTGDQLGMPLTDGSVSPADWSEGSFVGWDGWGCRPVWRNGLPVLTDGDVAGFVRDRFGNFEVVSVSSRYDEPCVAFAGNELRGTPVTDRGLMWKERLSAWGLPLLTGLLVVLGLGWWIRRRKGSWRQPLRRRPMIIGRLF
ncbi:hypothetical protein [Knoellia subterranea]|uniref:Uncharacterized protein n=1 Tax=Knoellia subterranea KCTC 19937 TaxID=1385521 RepID=A0A0A0JMV1_9MICO|nr:hypothetical protein [Knoellia subterranea]KGN36946.1 hypothetical protein N803_16150 [Knoellia subterranea KCTC 19937]